MHFCHLMISYLCKQQKKLCAIYKDGAIAEIHFHRWLARPRSRNLDLEDQECSGRPGVIDDRVEMLIKNNAGHMTQDTAEIFYFSLMIIGRHLEKLGHVNHCDVSCFTIGQKIHSIILTWNTIKMTWKWSQVIKKWIVYDNVEWNKLCVKTFQKQVSIQRWYNEFGGIERSRRYIQKSNVENWTD